jgi:hypothetical protein
VRGARGFDPTALVEQFRATIQETIESVLESHGESAASGPSEMIQLVTMLRDAIAPALHAFTAKVMMSDANGLPGPYKPMGT